MTLKKNLDTEGDRAWRTKGGAYKRKICMPRVCHDCLGSTVLSGTELDCPTCGGTGEIWEYESA